MDATSVSRRLARANQCKRELPCKCDRCCRPGTNLWGNFWLCAFCWLKAENEMRREAYKRVPK